MVAFAFENYRTGSQVRHSITLMGDINASPLRKRITPSDVEQKLLAPVELDSGVPTTTNS